MLYSCVLQEFKFSLIIVKLSLHILKYIQKVRALSLIMHSVDVTCLFYTKLSRKSGFYSKDSYQLENREHILIASMFKNSSE